METYPYCDLLYCTYYTSVKIPAIWLHAGECNKIFNYRKKLCKDSGYNIYDNHFLFNFLICSGFTLWKTMTRYIVIIQLVAHIVSLNHKGVIEARL